jgi:hypothetical protein
MRYLDGQTSQQELADLRAHDSEARKVRPPRSKWHFDATTRNCFGNGALNDSRTGTAAMRIQTYRDESRSRHFDLKYGGARARSIDLVSVTSASMLLASFACALVIPFAICPNSRAYDADEAMAHLHRMESGWVPLFRLGIGDTGTPGPPSSVPPASR